MTILCFCVSCVNLVCLKIKSSQYISPPKATLEITLEVHFHNSGTKPPSPRIPPSTVDQFRNKENVQECHPGLDGEVVCSFPADPTVESLLQNKAMECVNGDCDEEACARHPACQDRDKNKSNKKNGSHSTFVKNKGKSCR